MKAKRRKEPAKKRPLGVRLNDGPPQFSEPVEAALDAIIDEKHRFDDAVGRVFWRAYERWRKWVMGIPVHCWLDLQCDTMRRPVEVAKMLEQGTDEEHCREATVAPGNIGAMMANTAWKNLGPVIRTAMSHGDSRFLRHLADCVDAWKPERWSLPVSAGRRNQSWVLMAYHAYVAPSVVREREWKRLSKKKQDLVKACSPAFGRVRIVQEYGDELQFPRWEDLYGLLPNEVKRETGRDVIKHMDKWRVTIQRACKVMRLPLDGPPKGKTRACAKISRTTHQRVAP